MKTFLPLLFLIISISSSAQIITATTKAGFRVDGGLRANYVNGFNQSGPDDWFWYPGSSGSGKQVIDTTGAAAIVAQYLSNPATRYNTFYRGMRLPAYYVGSQSNNRLWMDALFVRDYHGTDTTVFDQGTSKNGMSPGDWAGAIQSVPDKNEILDAMMHVRRDGDGQDPSRIDSLWFFGGISIENTTGNRYFDFEMYQTDIYYNRPTKKFYGYGPDAGHTTWEFDASGNVLKPGDIIFSAEYQSDTLTRVEARIWINKASLSLIPNAFTWAGTFDGASTGSTFGYAGILPKTAGIFYTGLENKKAEWAGPFKLVRQDNSLVDNYLIGQYMEFSVNLTKLGLDPVTTFGRDFCGTPFNRVLIKTRASGSFNSSLKDFVAPLDLFFAPRVDALADVPLYCGVMGVSNLQVMNPSSTSVYTWTTLDGHFPSTTTGTNVTVDAPGTYVVTQQLAAGCNAYATDTVAIVYDASCKPMASRIVGFRGALKNTTANLVWTTKANNETAYFEIQRSIDGNEFQTVGKVEVRSDKLEQQYAFNDDVSEINSLVVFFRLKVKGANGSVSYTPIIRLEAQQSQTGFVVFPNPIEEKLQLLIPSLKQQEANISVFDLSGSLLTNSKWNLKQGANSVGIPALNWKPGIYLVNVRTTTENVWKKFIVAPPANK